MADSRLVLTLHGVRGSADACGPSTDRHGSNTTCMSVDLGTDGHLVIDCGSGLQHLARLLRDTSRMDPTFVVLLTHYHWDHIHGLPFFTPFLEAGNRFRFHGPDWRGRAVEQLLPAVVQPPYFPIPFEEFEATTEFSRLAASDAIQVGALRVTWTDLHHPQGSMAFRLDGPASSIVIATDHEHGTSAADRRLQEFASGADVLIHDAQYTRDEYATRRRGWGHSTWEGAVAAARASGVARLVLTSHDPSRTDDAIDGIVAEARSQLPSVEAGRQGMEIPL